MASNVSPGQRTFALIIALIFLLTTVATGFFVVASIVNEGKNKDTASTSATTPAEETAADATCPIGTEPGQAVLPAPEVYKPSGDIMTLEKTDIEVGTGEVVKAGDCLIAKYYGTLATTGEMFDENFTTDQGLTFQVGAGSVIEGWDQGIVGMNVGGTRRLVIPSDLAYKDQAAGSIPANSDLVFVVKVIAVKK